MNPPPVAFNSNAQALIRSQHFDHDLLPSPPRRDILHHGPGLTFFQLSNRVGHFIAPGVNLVFRPLGPDRWKSRIEDLFRKDDERERLLDELYRNPNCLYGRLKSLESHCHELLKLARPDSTTVNTQLMTFKILVAMITRYPGIRRLLHTHQDLRRELATDPSLSSAWKRPYQSCGEEWTFYRNFAVFCISDNAFESTKLMEAELPSTLSRVKLEGNLNKVPIEILLGHSRCGPEFHLSRLCAIRYLAGILELPSFWGRFSSNASTKRERKRFLDVLSELCSTILGLIQDTEGNGADMSVDFSPSTIAGRSAVDILSYSMLNGLLRLRNFNNLPPCVPAALPVVVSMLVRDDGKSYPRAFEPASQVEVMLAFSPFSPLEDENPVDSPEGYQYKAKAVYAYSASADDPNEISFTKGEILDIFDKQGKWWQAKKADGTVGIVPSDHLRIISQDGSLELPDPVDPPEGYQYEAKAMYAYSASADDPNEISFTKGEILDIVDKQGKWWQAEKADGTVGIVPSNYLRIISQDGSLELPDPVDPPEGYQYEAKAMYAYSASADDPNEISFTKGEILDIVDKQGKWWQAKKADGTVGIVPSNYFRIISWDGSLELPDPVDPPEGYQYKAKTVYAYSASADDPNEISFTEGEILDIVDKQGKWWQAKKADGTVGIVPSNYLQVI
ncbi:hypothetical protein MVEN_00910300 [Mycena venus]|uniref:SH3 domain-containing protein n=1 Tax=Mycena venus TaxID=2733690 RepID=A0A8H6YCG7_9AGAR|nr:hypothetical protein MVEN_00910300 [Mycena venus]